MQLAVSDQAGARVVTVPGPRLDAAVAESFKAELCRLIDGGVRSFALDVSRIEFMDSSGLGAIVACFKHLGTNGSMALAQPQEQVMKVLRLTRMNKVFTIRDAAATAP